METTESQTPDTPVTETVTPTFEEVCEAIRHQEARLQRIEVLLRGVLHNAHQASAYGYQAMQALLGVPESEGNGQTPEDES